jgi:hypothetical protein
MSDRSSSRSRILNIITFKALAEERNLVCPASAL